MNATWTKVTHVYTVKVIFCSVNTCNTSLPSWNNISILQHSTVQRQQCHASYLPDGLLLGSYAFKNHLLERCLGYKTQINEQLPHIPCLSTLPFPQQASGLGWMFESLQDLFAGYCMLQGLLGSCTVTIQLCSQDTKVILISPRRDREGSGRTGSGGKDKARSWLSLGGIKEWH